MFSHALPLVPFPHREPASLSTGFPGLDARLTGIPVGRMVEISGPESSGKASLAWGMCLALLEQQKTLCWIDAQQHFWPLATLEARGSLEGLWVLRVPNGKAALHGAHLLLGCPGAVALVVIDLPPRFQAQEIQLLKLQRLAERAGAGLVLLTQRDVPGPSLGSTVALHLQVKRRSSLGLHIDVLRHKGGATHQTLEENLHGPNRLRVDSSL